MMYRTLRDSGPPSELSDDGMVGAVAFYADLKILLPMMVAMGALLLAAAAIGSRWRNREFFTFSCIDLPYLHAVFFRIYQPPNEQLLVRQGMRGTGCSGP